mmetsp:Transcript_32469/g.65792  ORF Transcript_32469/g.65792 Transcript_32469/m.65792 type:complete len:120 (-) Transcript_32469:3737-4096(-)
MSDNEESHPIEGEGEGPDREDDDEDTSKRTGDEEELGSEDTDEVDHGEISRLYHQQVTALYLSVSPLCIRSFYHPWTNFISQYVYLHYHPLSQQCNAAEDTDESGESEKSSEGELPLLL